jgi:hypothetical protein
MNSTPASPNGGQHHPTAPTIEAKISRFEIAAKNWVRFAKKSKYTTKERYFNSTQSSVKVKLNDIQSKRDNLRYSTFDSDYAPSVSDFFCQPLRRPASISKLSKLKSRVTPAGIPPGPNKKPPTRPASFGLARLSSREFLRTRLASEPVPNEKSAR